MVSADSCSCSWGGRGGGVGKLREVAYLLAWVLMEASIVPEFVAL